MSSNALPPIMEEIADAADIEAAWQLVRAHGGTKVYIPNTCGQGHWLAQLVGIESARLICARLGGQDIVLPNADGSPLRKAQAVMNKALLSGASLNEAARASGMSIRSASRARKRLSDPSQLKLFE